jgi:hypothetical protein
MAKVIMFGTEYVVKPVTHTYHNGNMAVRLMGDDGSPFATLSVNLPESDTLPKDQFFVKDWSENEGLANQLLEQGEIKLVGDVPNSMDCLVYKLAN